MDARLRIELFGGLRVQQGERVITRFRTQKTASLLACLAYHVERAHTREVLAELLWPEHTPQSGRLNLNTALHSLRKQLEPPGVPAGAVIISNRFLVQLNPDAVTVDVAEFESALQLEKQTHSQPEQTHHLLTAVKLYRGELLPGFYDEWIEQERTRLEETYLHALDRLCQLLAQARDFDRALDYARRAINADPLREEAHVALMRLYVDAGQPAAALEQYQELKRLLKEFLNAAPSATTRALVRDLSEQLAVSSNELVVVSGGRVVVSRQQAGRRKVKEEQTPVISQPAPVLQFPTPHPSSLISHPSSVGSLPLQFTRFFGREEEIAQLRETLLSEGTRLITLTGAGGSGKTRLAIETVGRLWEQFTGGVWFVPLADISDPRLIAAKVRDTLRLPRLPHVEPLEQVVDALNRSLVVPPLGGKNRWDKPPEGGTTNSTTNRSVRPLLVLDNFEHLAAGGALVVLTLLKRVPSLRALVTSRRRLNVGDEREFPVLPLPTPQTSVDSSRLTVGSRLPSTVNRQLSTVSPESLMTFPSMQLFVDRAQAARPDFQVTKRNASAVAELCRRLEGIPLAIELAAARAQVLTVAQMLDRISKRFDLLSKRRADTTLRHRSLWAAMEWSYHLLSPELQRFFASLSVFRGGWTVEAAEQVCCAEDTRIQRCKDMEMQAYNDASAESPPASLHPCISASVVEYLAQLRSHSLVLAEESEPEMRYRMLETLREFGVEQLTAEEQSALSQRHANYFLSLAEEAKPHLDSPGVGTWLARLETEHDNLRAALQWCVDSGDGEAGVRMGGSLWRLWSEHGHLREGREWLAKLVILPGASARTKARAHALNGAGNLAYAQGDLAAARAFLEEALAIRQERDDRRGVAGILNNLANVVSAQGDDEMARTLYEQALVINRELSNRTMEAVNLYNLGKIASDQGDQAAARALHEQGLAVNRELGNRAWEAYDLLGMGMAAWRQGDTAAARTLCQQSLALFREFGNRKGIAQALYGLGMAACRAGDPDKSARSFYEESLTMYRELGDKRGIASALKGMAELSLVVPPSGGSSEPPSGGTTSGGTPSGAERAARLWGAAESLREAIGAPLPPCDHSDYERHVVVARAVLGEKAFSTAWAHGRALPLEQAIAYALQETAE